MKCPNCGGQMGLEDAFCPYCGTRNAEAAQHQSDMAHFRQEYQRTQAEVAQKTSFLQRHGSWLIILTVLLVALIVGIILQVSAWDIGYSIRENNIQRTAVEDSQVMDAYLAKGDYGQFVGYYDANSISFDDENPYQGVHSAASAYVDLLKDVASVNRPSSWTLKPEYISDTCDYIARSLMRIYTVEEQYSYNTERYLPADKRVFIDDIRGRAGAIAKTYFGLTDEEVQEIPNMSERRLSTLIERGIAS